MTATDPNTIRLWLSVSTPGAGTVGGGTLWVRDLVTAHMPAVGEEIILWPDEDGDPGEGPPWGVRHRYWDADGLANIELVRMWVDPPEDARFSFPGHRPWRTANDGHPIPNLERGGWIQY